MDDSFYVSGQKYIARITGFFNADPKRKWYLISVVLALLFVFLYIFVAIPPKNFPVGSVLSVERGTGLYTLSNELEQKGIIRSPFWFRVVVITFGGEHKLQSGDYSLARSENIFTLARRIVNAEYNIPLRKITIPEGFTDEDISLLFDIRFGRFDHPVFLNLAKQGYMFPDTYLIEQSITASTTIALFENNFHTKVDPLNTEIIASGRTLDNVLTLASILEAEIKLDKDRKIVAGILLKRLKMGMFLQVDSAPETYNTLGLPSAPINNPGLGSIKAALEPTSSKYLYFLTDKAGNVHYATTFNEHTKNIKRYLN